METQGIIEESTSPWTSPVILKVKKKDNKTVWIIAKLTITIKDSYPLTRIGDIFNQLLSNN